MPRHRYDIGPPEEPATMRARARNENLVAGRNALMLGLCPSCWVDLDDKNVCPECFGCFYGGGDRPTEDG